MPRMKALMFLFVLSSLAFAQCNLLVSNAETQYAGYVELDSIDCELQGTELLYHPLAKLAEGYSLSAQCFREQGNLEKSGAYSALAARKYFLAADALCTTDPGLKMQLYVASGDSYKAAGQLALARESYGNASHTYLRHNMQLDSSLNAELQKKIYELNRSFAGDYRDVVDEGAADWVPYAIMLLVFFGIALTVISLKKR